MKTSTSARSPLSPTLWPPDAFVWWQSLLFVVVVLIATYVPVVIIAAFLIAFGVISPAQFRTTSLTAPLLLAQTLAYLFAFGVVAVGLPTIARRPLAALGLRAPRARDVGWGLAGAVVMVVAAIATGALEDAIFHLKPDEVQVHVLRATQGAMIVGFAFLACVAAPFFEEVVFRGFLFNAILRYVPAWAAVMLSAVLFGFAHFQPGNAGAILPLAAGGAVLATVYYRTGSLIASMITHATFNAFTVVAVVVFHQT